MGLREAFGAWDIWLADWRRCQLQSAARAIAIAVARDGSDIPATLVPAIAHLHFLLDSGFRFRHNQRDEGNADCAGTKARSNRYRTRSPTRGRKPNVEIGRASCRERV